MLLILALRPLTLGSRLVAVGYAGRVRADLYHKLDLTLCLSTVIYMFMHQTPHIKLTTYGLSGGSRQTSTIS